MAGKSSAAKAGPLQPLVDQMADIVNGQTDMVGVKVVVFGLYPNAERTGLDEVELGELVGSVGRSKERPATKAGKPQGGNVNVNVNGKLRDARSPLQHTIQFGGNATFANSNQGEWVASG